MAGLILPHRWTRQPQGPVDINWGHPSTRKLGVAWYPQYSRGFREVSRRVPVTIGSGSSIAGGALICNAADSATLIGIDSDANLYGGGGHPLYSSAEWTALAIATPGTLGVRQALFGFGRTSPLGASLLTGYGTSSSVFCYLTLSTYVPETAAGTFVSGERASFGVAWAYAQSPQTEFFKNARSIATAAQVGASTTLGSVSDGYQINIGGMGSTTLDERHWSGSIELVLQWARRLPTAEYLSIAQNPWQLFQPYRRRFYIVTGTGGSSYNVNIAESLTATDTLSAQLAFAPSLSEAASAADAISNALTSARSVAEAAGAADTVSTGAATYPVTITETGSAADSLTTTATFPRSIGTEAASAADSVTSGAATYSATIAETLTAVDSISALLNATVALTETASAADTVSSLATLIAQLAESVSATDSLSSALNSTSYNVSLTEAASAADSLSAAWQAAAGIAETGIAADTLSAQANFSRALAEAVTALDIVGAAGILGVTITETANATDSVSAPTGFGEVPPSRTITIEMARRTITIQLANRTIQIH